MVTKERGCGDKGEGMWLQRRGDVVTKERGCGDKKRVVTSEDVVTRERGCG